MTGYTGTIAGVAFEDGRSESPLPPAVRAYASRHGLTVDDDGRLLIGTPDEPDRIDSRDVTETKVGTPLRDAAVDPRPGDFLPPINAGEADPHGPEVVAPHVHGAPDRPVRPDTAPAARDSDGGTGEGENSTAPERPAKSANKAEWEAYAVARGFLDDPSELTKADLIDRFGED